MMLTSVIDTIVNRDPVQVLHVTYIFGIDTKL